MTVSQVAKRVFFCECIGFDLVASNIVSMDFIWPGPTPRGGQFFMIRPRRTGVFLGRPISVAGWKPRKSGRGCILRFFVAMKGAGSQELADLREGSEAELIGPLGKPWPVSDISPNYSKVKQLDPVALVGGGIGIAPLLLLAAELGKRSYDFYAGFKTAPYGLEQVKPRSLILTCEDGSQGLRGRITDFFSPLGYGGVFACGPQPMLKQLAEVCRENMVPCYVSMERHMACGVGACLGCTVKTTKDYLHCCTDGPIFRTGEIIFED